MTKQYGNDSVTQLKGADTIRLKPASILGSDGLEGAFHTFIEILANAIDEWRESPFSHIEVIKHKDNSLTIKDLGRGCPVDWNSVEEKFNYELVFMTLYAGGKYKTNDGENYEYSLGTNGLGATATQFTSEYMDVVIHRDGYKYDLHFEKGNIVGDMKKEKCRYDHTGTEINWIPDREVFMENNIPIVFIKDLLKRQAVVNAGLKFILTDETTNSTFEYVYNEGVEGYIKEWCEGKNFTDVVMINKEVKGRDREDKPEYKVKMQVGFTFTNYNNFIEYFHNSSFLEYGGSPDKAVRSAFVSAIDKYLKSNNRYNKNEKKITFDDVKDSVIVVTNTSSTMTSYENQTKKSITNEFIKLAMTDFIKEQLEIYFTENKTDADKITTQILINKRAREKSEQTKVDVRKKLSGEVNVLNKVDGFIDCRSKDNTKTELYIVEGKSALGSVVMGRDADYQAVIPIRGKILNCLKADYDKIFKNSIIVDLLKVLGCGVEVKGKHKDLANFDINKLRWSKIVIATDADVDGQQIRTLLLTMFYVLAPTLIEEKKIHIVESPLFEIIDKKENSYFAYNDKERDVIVGKLNGECKVQRSKGLGENTPEFMSVTTMNPKTRKLIEVLPDDVVKTNKAFDLFLGDNLQGRKDFISEYGYKYIDYSDLD